MRKKIYILAVVLLGIFLAGGCRVRKAGAEKIRDVEYTVLEETEIPETLRNEIEQRKAEDFKMSYCEGDGLYIVRGFGMQETGGYSIQMQELYLAENAIYFAADLIGPENGQDVEKTVSYPYIAVKTERLEENVVFE